MFVFERVCVWGGEEKEVIEIIGVDVIQSHRGTCDTPVSLTHDSNLFEQHPSLLYGTKTHFSVHKISQRLRIEFTECVGKVRTLLRPTLPDGTDV